MPREATGQKEWVKESCNIHLWILCQLADTVWGFTSCCGIKARYWIKTQTRCLCRKFPSKGEELMLSLTPLFIHPHFFFWTFYFVLGVWSINNIVIVSGGQQRNSAIHIRVSILPQAPLPSRLPYNIEQSSMCYTVGSCWLSILNIAVCACQFQTPNLSLAATSLLW